MSNKFNCNNQIQLNSPLFKREKQVFRTHLLDTRLIYCMFSARRRGRNADTSVQAQCSHEDRIDNIENEINATAQPEEQEEEEEGPTQNAHAHETHAEQVLETHDEQPTEDGGGAEDAAREETEQDIPPHNADAAPEEEGHYAQQEQARRQAEAEQERARRTRQGAERNNRREDQHDHPS